MIAPAATTAPAIVPDNHVSTRNAMPGRIRLQALAGVARHDRGRRNELPQSLLDCKCQTCRGNVRLRHAS